MPEASGLAVENLHVRYGRRTVLRGLTLPTIEPKRFTVVAGPNGAGKSTLLHALAGLVPATGSIRLDGHELVGAAPASRAATVAFMPQALPHDLAFPVLEAVIHACRAGRSPPSSLTAAMRAGTVLARLELGHLAQVPVGRLSGGQRQLTSLAQALVRQPRLLLLDEPLSALDLHHQHAVLRILRELADEGLIVVAVLHDLIAAATWSDRIVMIREGSVVADGSPEQVVTPATLANVYGVDAKVWHHDDASFGITVRGAISR